MNDKLNIKNKVRFLSVVILTVGNITLFSVVFAQKGDTITDFYEYANWDWLNSTIIPKNTSVVNNWGILWNRITDKSIEILSGDSTYNLDQNHQYTLKQLRNFYASAINYSNDNRKRVELIQKYYPMLFGILFSNITIHPSKEEKIKELLNFLCKAYESKIRNSNKIGTYYKELFLSKLDGMEFEIGSPDISSFSKIPSLSTHDLEKNILLSQEFQIVQKAKAYNIGWESPPYETDCRYNFQDNKVKIYAGTLYTTNFIMEHNIGEYFATIGRTIAHEMTHAFDNVGKNYNKYGEYITWYRKLFTAPLFPKNEWKDTYHALKIQYDKYTIQDSLFLDGEKTLQENFADLGGVEISLLALKLYLNENQFPYSEDEKSIIIEQYFINYVQFWREKATPEFELSSLKRLHAPQKFRAIGPVYNQDEFYEVFAIDKKSKYYITANMRISIW